MIHPRWATTLILTPLIVVTACSSTTSEESASTTPPPPTATSSTTANEINEVLAGHTVARLGGFLGDVDDAYWDVTRRDYLNTASTDFTLLMQDLEAAGPDLSYVTEFQQLGPSLTEALEHSVQDIYTSAEMYLLVRTDVVDLLDVISYDLGVEPNAPPARELQDLPEAAPEPSTDPQDSYSFDESSGEATFAHFTAALMQQSGTDASSFQIEVCLQDDARANPEPYTTVSTQPWQMITAGGIELSAEPSTQRSPAYPREALISRGECVTGWISFPLSSDDTASHITYMNSYGESATWSLPSPAPSATKKPTTTTTTPRASTPASTPAPRPERSVASPPAYDAAWASTVVDWVIEDVALADEYLLDGPRDAYLPMDDLADSMRRLQELGAPTGVDPAYLYALTGSLGESYDTAYYYLYPDPFTYDVIDGAATYSVARGYTQELLDLLGPAIGKTHKLPRWSFMSE